MSNASNFAARGESGWAIYSILTGILFPIGIFLASAAFAQTENLVAFGGLIQRVTVTPRLDLADPARGPLSEQEKPSNMSLCSIYEGTL